jgi:ABC-type phosphate/phosphonate transport system substrate-binding protein
MFPLRYSLHSLHQQVRSQRTYLDSRKTSCCITLLSLAKRNWAVQICLSLLFAFAGAAPCNAQPDLLLLGMARSLTKDVPEATTRAGLPAVALLVQKSTGVPCKILDPMPYEDLGERLAKDRLQLAIFQGVEFAWEHPNRPELRPLVILVNQQRDRQAKLVIRADSAAGRWFDLKNTALALPQRSRDHCRLFIERHCRENGGTPEQFFSRITAPTTVEDALDDLAEGAIGAAVVDRIGLTSYERRKPGRYGKLKVLLSSERFPDTVIAYHAGALDEATLQRFRQGLLQADKTLVGRHMLALWTATSFELPPADFEKLLVDIPKSYPAPDPAVRK